MLTQRSKRSVTDPERTSRSTRPDSAGAPPSGRAPDCHSTFARLLEQGHVRGLLQSRLPLLLLVRRSFVCLMLYVIGEEYFACLFYGVLSPYFGLTRQRDFVTV